MYKLKLGGNSFITIHISHRELVPVLFTPFQLCTFLIFGEIFYVYLMLVST